MKRVIKHDQVSKLAKEIQDDILDSMSELLKSFEFGFTLEEVSDSLFVDVQDVDDKIRIEVRCKLGFAGMKKLVNVLNEVIKKYDSNAHIDNFQIQRRDSFDVGIVEVYLDTADDSVESTIHATEDTNGVREFIIKQVQDDVLDAASKLLRSPEFGFPLDEIADYLFVDVEELDDKRMIRVEVRCELTYRSMEKLVDVLDKVIRKYDDNAYFDFVDVGIIETYLTVVSDKVVESTDIGSGLNVKFILNTLEKAAEAVNKYGDLIELIRKVSRIYPEAAKKYRKMARDFKENPRELAKDILKDMENILLDPVESSIIPAVARGLATHAIVDKITSEENLEPPEDTRTVEDGIEGEIRFHLNEIIEVDDKGNWDFVEEDPKSFINPDSSDGSWYFYEYDIEMCDPVKLYEDTCDVIYMEVPAQAGRYRIKADMVMNYYTDDIYVTEDRYKDEDGDVVRDIEDVDTDVYFDERGSYHTNLEIQSV